MIRRHAALTLCALAASGCSPPTPAVLPDCDYPSRSGAEFVFVLPSLEAAASGSEAFTFHTAPRRSARLWLTSLRYGRDYAGKRYRLLGTVEGADGNYRQWLVEDCRLLYSPVEAGLPGGEEQ